MLFKFGFTNISQNQFDRCYSKQTHKSQSKLVPKVLLKIVFTNNTLNYFHYCYSKERHKKYSKLVSRTFLEIDLQTLLKIGSTSVNRSILRNNTQSWFDECQSKYAHKGYSKFILRVVLEIDPQTFLKNCFKNVIRNHKCYSNLVSQKLLKISSTSVTQNRPMNVTQTGSTIVT